MKAARKRDDGPRICSKCRHGCKQRPTVTVVSCAKYAPAR